MNRVGCEIRLAKGKWRNKPVKSETLGVIRRIEDGDLEVLRATPLEHDADTEQRLEVVMVSQWRHDEAMCDCLATALVNALQPEFESMVEVEVTDV